MKLLWIFIVWSFIFEITVGDDPPGHLKPLGAHAPPIGSPVESGMFPTPQIFYEHFVKEGKPLIFRNVLNMEGVEFPAYAKWSDDYLSKTFGTEIVEVERGKKEDRSQGLLRMQLSRFLDTYQNSNVYLVHNVPPSMQEDIHLPVSALCGGFQKVLMEAVMWFSSGGTKSVLHYDGADNINCVLDGTKEFVFIDKAHRSLVEANDFNKKGSYSWVDVDKVDMYKFPKFQSIPWYKVHMKKGDCIFIPHGWYHQVNTGNSRSIALNFWFSPLLWFDTTDCEDTDVSNQTYPLSQFKFATPNEQMRSGFLYRYKGMPALMKGDFLHGTDQLDKAKAEQLYDYIDSDRNGFLTWDELYSFDIDEVVKKFPDLLGLLEEEDDDEEEENEEETSEKKENTYHEEL